MKQNATERWIYIVAGLIVVSWVTASVLLQILDVGLAVRLLIGVVPVALLLVQIFLAFRYTIGQDEVQRRIILEGLAIAFVVALPVIFLVGFRHQGWCQLAPRVHRCRLLHGGGFARWLCPGLQAVPMKNRLRVLRAEYDWTQEDLARKLGISRQAVIAIEKEKYDPSLPLAFKIARLFRKRIEEIFLEREAGGGEDEDISP